MAISNNTLDGESTRERLTEAAHQTVDKASAKAAKFDSESTRERLTEAAHHTVDQASAKAARIESSVRDAAENMQQQAHNVKVKAEEGREQLTSTLRTYIDERPLTALAVAFGVGVVLSSLLRR